MKSDHWLLKKIIEEAVTKRDIAHLRKLLSNGYSDEQVLNALRGRMCSNAKGMQSYIRQEKIRALVPDNHEVTRQRFHMRLTVIILPS